MLSHSVTCPMNQQNNALVPVLFSGDGNAVIVGGTAGSVRVMDSHSYETLQVLSHDGQLFTPEFCVELTTSVGDLIQAVVRISDRTSSLSHFR